MIASLTVSLITVAAFLLSVLFFPTIGKKGKLKIYSLIPFVGAFLIIALSPLTVKEVISCFTENTSVNPVKILVLFLSMTVYSLILDKTGFFVYISNAVLKRAGHNQFKLFLSLYAVISVLTVFTSNDIVILTFTPFICHFCRSAKINAMPYLIMEFVAANTWSMLLLIRNPTNIYISGAFGITFSQYLVKMALPAICAGVVSLGIMLALFAKPLKVDMSTDTQPCEITDVPLMSVALAHLILCIILLSVSQYTGIEMWLISLGVALSAVICSVCVLAFRRKSILPVTASLKGLPYEIIPFVVGMFIIVLSLDISGVTAYLAGIIGKGEQCFTYGIASMLSSNLLNNIPMSVLFSKILASGGSEQAIYATIAGSNIGAVLTPVGALAGIMWSNIIKENGVRMSVGKFVVYGFCVGVPTMLSLLFVIMLTV
jgi:arsenical pump membrane protein